MANGLYDPADEHDACGTGFVATTAGQATHEVLALGLMALVNLTHRGAAAADAASGDGAGILTQLPFALLAPLAEANGGRHLVPGDLAVGMVFMPADDAGAAGARARVEAGLVAHGLDVAGWRDVPVEPTALGEAARASRPSIRQVLVTRPPGMPASSFARALFLARKAIERAGDPGDLYLCSLSATTIVYKALALAEQLAAFYPDLRDPAYLTAYAVFHQRYSTNTFPTWALAQPFRRLGHNGEINTLSGNKAWMVAREAELAGGGWSAQERAGLAPIIQAGGSDSAALDDVLDLLVASGRDVVHAVRMLVPEACGPLAGLDADRRAFYEFHGTLVEPWDGPAALAFADGAIVGACLDRNGLRPARYVITGDGLVVLGSEAGMVDLGDRQIVSRGRLGPGQILAVDTAAGQVLHHDAIMQRLSARQPYGAWLADAAVAAPVLPPALGILGDATDLPATQRAHGYTSEDLDKLFGPMAREGKESIGSMGDDTPLAVFSGQPRSLFDYFKQRFAQVTNPPMDPLRERLMMSLDTALGARGPWLDEGPGHARVITLPSPLLDDAQLAWLRQLAEPAFQTVTLDATWDVAAGSGGLSAGLARLGDEAAAAVRAGLTLLIVSDRALGPTRVAMPMLLAVAAVHQHLVQAGLRLRCSLICETGEAREDHHVAALIGYGAGAVNHYLANRTVASLVAAGKVGELDLDAALANYRAALEAGLYKIMAKMGICTVRSYRGARVFDAIGLGADVIDRYFPGTASRLGGLGLGAIADDALAIHAEAYANAGASLPDRGRLRFRVDGEYHQNNPKVFKAIQTVGKTGEATAMADLATLIRERPNVSPRDLLAFKPVAAVDLVEVEPAEAIARRFVASAMSLGALSKEAHECIALAMNRLGARSNSGEGGEDLGRYAPRPDGDCANSTIKQVAAGRFGVTPHYLASAQEIEIKMAQGAKPGEGGQLPGFKVDAEIAKLRHATPGITLISPPPHHDIYSIEDLAQLIHDMRAVNPRAAIAVKLVSSAGVGTIAAGVVKARADVIHLSGHDGGTGASALGSLRYAGNPWEVGLAEVQQVLVRNGLRGRVRLRVDGGLKSGRDVLVAALLGADEFGFGTALVVAAGCVMARQCHQNTCPVGIATQNPTLRAKFKGTPGQIVNYLLALAQDVREGLAALGLRTLDEAVGRVELLAAVPAASRAGSLDLTPLLSDLADGGPRRSTGALPVAALDGLVRQLADDTREAIAQGGSWTGRYAIRNTDRSVGAAIAGAIAALDLKAGAEAPQQGGLDLTFVGTAGQSFGAFGLTGMALHLVGEANDYVGKGLAGALITIRPAASDSAGDHAIVGNTCLYGATGGAFFAAGSAGQRFAVRNSGSRAVIEGVGDHGCEYMTGGTVVVLGRAGRNFGAGMSGGTAYVLDEDGSFAARANEGSVALSRLEPGPDETALRGLIMEHLLRTGSPRAADLLADWPAWRRYFWHVVPSSADTHVRPRGWITPWPPSLPPISARNSPAAPSRSSPASPGSPA